LLQLVLAIADLEQRVGKLARLRILVDHALKGAECRRERILVHVVGLAQPVLGIVGELAVRIAAPGTLNAVIAWSYWLSFNSVERGLVSP
jgi:hypothetical protein